MIEKAGKKKPVILEDLITNRRYREVVESIRQGTYHFKPVRRIEIPKPGSSDKRVVYTCKRDDMTEHTVLRLFAYLLQSHDKLFANNLYSFRNEGGVQKAIARMRRVKDMGSKYAYKVDIKQYFNSVDQLKMLNVLKKTGIDKDTINLISSIICVPDVEFEGKPFRDEHRGIMPGLPFSSFLSNLYLSVMDHYFESKHVEYYRFADDILVLADSEEELRAHIRYIHSTLKRRGLTINPDKEIRWKPHEKIEFLGLSIQDGVFDLNDKSLHRIISKIRIEGRKYRKCVEKGEKKPNDAVHCFVVGMEHKFFGYVKNSRKCWTHWYFPLITTDVSLKKIDHQVQEWIRYIVTGRHVKSNNSRIPYKYLSDMEYVTLVNRFYDRKRNTQS